MVGLCKASQQQLFKSNRNPSREIWVAHGQHVRANCRRPISTVVDESTRRRALGVLFSARFLLSLRNILFLNLAGPCERVANGVQVHFPE